MSEQKTRRKQWPHALAISATIMFACAAAPTVAQSSDATTTLGTRIILPAPTTIAEGTSVLLAVKQTLKSGSAKKGEPVVFEVAADAFSPDRRTLLIAKGTRAFGEVEQSRGAGAFGSSGSLRVRCNYLELADGTHVPLRPAGAGMRAQGRNQSGTAVGIGLLVGVVAAFAASVPVAIGDGLSGKKSNSSAGGFAFVGSALLTSALIRGGNVTIREGKIFEAATAAEAPLSTNPKPTNVERDLAEKQ